MRVTPGIGIGIPARWRRGQPDLAGPARAMAVGLSKESTTTRLDIRTRAPGTLRIDVTLVRAARNE